jgi:hypothetical protein
MTFSSQRFILDVFSRIRRPFSGSLILDKQAHCCLHPTILVGNIRLFQTHPDTGQRSYKHQIVKVSQVTGAKHLIGHFGQTFAWGSGKSGGQLFSWYLLSHSKWFSSANARRSRRNNAFLLYQRNFEFIIMSNE